MVPIRPRPSVTRHQVCRPLAESEPEFFWWSLFKREGSSPCICWSASWRGAPTRTDTAEPAGLGHGKARSTCTAKKRKEKKKQTEVPLHLFLFAEIIFEALAHRLRSRGCVGPAVPAPPDCAGVEAEPDRRFVPIVHVSAMAPRKDDHAGCS